MGRRGAGRWWPAAGGVLLLAVAACGAPAVTGGTSPAGGSSGSGAASITTAADEPADGSAPGGAPTSPADPAADRPTTSAAPETASGPAPSLDAPNGAATTGPPTMAASAPVALSVPSIGIDDAALVELGRNADGTVEVPSLDDPDARPGWYRDSPTPGALGPAIILGHVDSRRYGPGVFYDLADLQPGAVVEVARADGSVAHFAVDSVREVAKRDFPTIEVYGNLDHAGLRLITCGGEFDPDASSYESNIIVFASLTGSS